MAVYQVAMFTMDNQSDAVAVMRIAWVDHNYKDYFVPAEVCVSELQPGAKMDCNYDYNGVKFVCIADWRFRQFRTFSGTHRIRCVWDGETIEIEGN
jgi:hypothetical protein